MSISVQFGRSPGNQVVLDGHGNTCNFISFIIQAFRGYHLSSNSNTEPSQESGDWYFRGICLEDEIAYVSISKIRKPLTLKRVCHLHTPAFKLEPEFKCDLSFCKSPHPKDEWSRTPFQGSNNILFYAAPPPCACLVLFHSTIHLWLPLDRKCLCLFCPVTGYAGIQQASPSSWLERSQSCSCVVRGLGSNGVAVISGSSNFDLAAMKVTVPRG